MKLFLIIVMLGCCVLGAGAVPAFPDAEGYGAVASGGRGGVVYEVTNLNDSGAGSLRNALLQSTTRTIVFRVSGTIHLNSNISVSNGNFTIAGQTAPGEGICIANGNLNISNCNNVIIRYIRCRLGDQWPDGTDNGDDDAIWGRYGNTIILDHVTASWSIDEAFSFYVNTNFTAQWCMITESLRYSHHEKTGGHGYGGIWGSTNSSWHHNLLAHHSSRNPRVDGEITNNVDMRNNVIYNWGFNSCYGGEQATVNIVNCYYKYGPATGSGVRDRIANPSAQKDAAGALIVPHTYGQWYVTGNYVYGSSSVTADNWLGMDPEVGGEQSLCKSTTQFPVAATYPVTTQTALEAYNSVLDNVGCGLYRDSVDKRIINEVKTGTATYGGTTGAGLGIIDTQDTVGGWPTLTSIPAPADSDHDGMPDVWETARDLNPADPADRNNDRDSDGYTNLEEYLNWLCTPDAKADVDRNCVIDLDDFYIFASAWMTQYGDADWNPLCDIAMPANDAVDVTDLMVLVKNWLWQSEQVQPPATIVLVASQGKAIQYKDDSGAWVSEQRLKTRASGIWDADPALNTLDANKSYLQFDLSGVTGTIASAALTIYAITDAKSYNVSGLNDGINETWSASTINWSSAPGNNTTSGSALNASQTVSLYSVNPTAANGAASGDVTSFVNADTDGLVTFILTAGGTTYMYNVIEGSYYIADYVPVLTIQQIE